MGFALVAHTKAQGTANGVTSGAINTTGATLLAIFLASYEGDPPPEISDDFNNEWSQIQIVFETNIRASWYFCPDPVVGPNHTFTANGTSSFPAIGVSAWSGPQVAVVDAASGSSSAPFLTSAQPGSVTPTVAGDLCLFGLGCGNAGSPSAPSVDSGFTLLGSVADTASSAGLAHAYLVQGAAAAINPKFTWTNSSDEACALICFKAVSSGGSGTPPPQPALAVTDKGDGTGATATISGGDAGAVNTVLVAPLPSGTGNVAFAQKASVNGNSSGALALTPGSYLAKAYATENGLTSLDSNEVLFRTTGGGLSTRTVVPSGHEGIFIAGVAYLIASSANFQSLVGAPDAAHALPFVKLEADDTEESGSTRPRVIVTPSPQFALRKVALQKFRPQGGVYVSFELPPTASILSEGNREDRLWDETLDFYNKVDPILLDCMNLQGTSPGGIAGLSQVAIHQIQLLDGPTAVNEVREEGHAGEVAQYFYGATYLFEFNG
ncbi:MAG TPA: hypothetical protein VJ783_27065 [Pirellulales bacterium]|nr:hypothetical protein [Pirellulales bacterium]